MAEATSIMKLTHLLPTLALACSPFTPLALGDHHGEKKDEAPKVELKPDVKIAIECNDSMQFNKKEFEVPAGKVVELTLHNVGKLPKVAMGHNLVISRGATLRHDRDAGQAYRIYSGR